MATHGYTLSQAAEDRITDALPVLAISIPEGPYLWNALREVLLGPHAAHALRTMHALRILEMLIPSPRHRRTRHPRQLSPLHRISTPSSSSTMFIPCEPPPTSTSSASPSCSLKSIASTFSFSRFFCTTPARAATPASTRSRVSSSRIVLARLDFDAEERDAILKLIRLHLDMSKAMRRDIFDLDNVRGFADKIGIKY